MTPGSEAYLKRIVRESVQETLDSLGFTTDQPYQIQADMMYLRKARIGSDEVAKWVRRTAVTTAVSGVLYALLEGIKLGLK